MSSETTLKGLDYLAELVRAIADPDDGEPGLPPGRPPRAGSIPTDMQQLRRQMAEKLAASIRENFRGVLNAKFTLSQGQARTLSEMAIPPETLEQVMELNYLQLVIPNHAINDRLRVISSIPNTPEGKPPRWTEWWLEKAQDHIGVYRPQDHDPQRDPVSETLNSVIAAIWEAALPRSPSPATIARHLAEHGWKGNGRKRDRIGISDVWAGIIAVRQLAGRLGVPPERRMPQLPESAEALLSELQEEGVQAARDMGTLGTPQEIRSQIDGARTRDLHVSVPGMRWYLKEANLRYLIDVIHVHGGHQNRVNDPREELTPAERSLMARTAPEHPGVYGIPTDSPDLAAQAIALVNRMTPQAVQQYIDGETEDPHPEEPPPCPQAGICRSWCGTLQDTGEMPFPLTHDGSYQSCRYREFLEKFGEMTPAKREPFALHQAQKEEKEEKERRNGTFRKARGQDREKGQDPGPEPDGAEAAPGRPTQGSLF